MVVVLVDAVELPQHSPSICGEPGVPPGFRNLIIQLSSCDRPPENYANCLDISALWVLPVLRFISVRAGCYKKPSNGELLAAAMPRITRRKHSKQDVTLKNHRKYFLFLTDTRATVSHSHALFYCFPQRCNFPTCCCHRESDTTEKKNTTEKSGNFRSHHQHSWRSVAFGLCPH